MVMPRSRSIGLESRTCASISRASRPPQSWMMRSARVDLPWSTWAMMEKFLICCMRGRARLAGSWKINARLSHTARLHRLHPPEAPRPGAPAIGQARRGTRAWSARGPGSARLGAVVGGHGDELRAALAAHQQHYRLARLDRSQLAVQRRGTGDRVAPYRQHHVT